MSYDGRIPAPVLAAWARTCRDGCGVNCGNRPCDACCAGGICDASPCICDNEVEDYYDDDDDATPPGGGRATKDGAP